MTIALWGVLSDQPLKAVYEELQRLGAATILIDQAKVLVTELDLCIGSELEGWIRVGDQRVDLAEVTAFHVRPNDWYRVPGMAALKDSGAERQHIASIDAALWAWAELSPALVVNRPQAQLGNGSKPYQLEAIRRHGFSVPDTVLTTDPDAVRAFWEQHGTVIYKSTSGIRSIVSRLTPDHIGRLWDVVHCPTQFQQYIAGVDYRVHVVGSEVFVSEIRCEADDYRYPGDSPVDVRNAALPSAIEDRCRLLAASADLPVAGIDLRRTVEDEWFCFEVNPAPAFTYYQYLTGQPISAAIARLLTQGR